VNRENNIILEPVTIYKYKYIKFELDLSTGYFYDEIVRNHLLHYY